MKKKIIILIVIIAIVVIGCFVGNKNNKENLELTAPAEYFYSHFQTFFDEDEYVKVGPFNEDSFDVEINDIDKYASIFKCYNGGNWKYGSQKFKINFIYTGADQLPNIQLGAMYDSDIENLFKGNKYYIGSYKEEGGFKFYFVLLKPEITQTYINNIGSPFGIDTISVETLCKEIVFRNTKMGVQFCSDKK